MKKIIRLLAIVAMFVMIAFDIAYLVGGGPKIKPRMTPMFTGVDSRAYPLAFEYVVRAYKNGIKFTRPISIGFADINQGAVVGICFRGTNFREIVVDNKAWKDTPYGVKKELLFHELTHCLCNRGHDYGDGKSYPPTELDWLVDIFHRKPFYMKLPGRFEDGCPSSIMYPYVLSQSCLSLHGKEYMKEMFNRCDPY
jgi:hypothetical protein